MNKQDMEYQSCQEFTPLPDEYPPSAELGGTSIHTKDSPAGRGHQAILRRMIQMMTVFTVITYTAVVSAKEETIAKPEVSGAVVEIQTGPEDNSLTGDTPGENTQTTQTTPTGESVENRGDETSKEPVSEETPATRPETESKSEAESETEAGTEPETETGVVEGQVCGTCGGTGDCDECKGDGYLGPGYTVACPRCHGSGVEICGYCDAAGNSVAHEGTCDFPPCMGSHTYACTICGGGSNAVTCASCGGSGECQTCGGTGYVP